MTAERSPAPPAWWPVLQALSDGAWVSGEGLARRLGVSRTAVWKQVGRLSELGLCLEQRRGKGYRLRSPIELLEPHRLLSELDGEAKELIGELHVLAEVDSTSTWLRGASVPCGSACLAELQTHGRGRRGRSWMSAPGRDLCLSLAWDFDQGLAALAGLSLAVGVGAAQVLERAGAEVQLKWPNDLLVDGRKIGGILIEAAGEAAGPCRAIIGIGVNIDSGSAGRDIDQEWTELRIVSGEPPGRNRLAGHLLGALLQVCRRFEKDGLAPFLEGWRSRDALAGAGVVVDLAGRRFRGRALGPDEAGQLQVETRSGLRVFSGGEVSIRRSKGSGR